MHNLKKIYKVNPKTFNLKKFINVKITFKAEKSQFIVFLKIEFFISIINNSEIEVFKLKTSEFKNFIVI